MVPQRTLWLGGRLGLLATAAFFAASSVNAMIATRLLPPLPTETSTAPPAGSAGTPPLSRYSAIAERDVFNPPRAVEPRAVESAPTAAALNARLLGTAPGEGVDSFAILEDGTSRKQELFRVGDRFQDRTLARVAWDHVVLRAGEREEILKLAEPSSRPAPAAAPAGDAVPDGSGIRALSETTYQIDRAEVDKAMENLNQIFTQVRAVPHFQDGKAAGFRLFAIRRDSIFEKLGLKNGDIVSRINGNELADPARAMSLLQELRGEGSVSVEVTRNRAPTTMSYEIR
jgi:general secretion pathway protein C